MDEIRGSDLLSYQRYLEEAARRKFPWNPEKCTHYMNTPPRQLLFACLTCRPSNAVCYACGIRCHSNHEIVELDSKRAFRCDCGTNRICGGSMCTLRPTRDDKTSNGHLFYCQNFEGRFCECHEHVHDDSYGHGAMFQCLVGTRCGEDWFHARCIAGISREEEIERQSRHSGSSEALNDSPHLEDGADAEMYDDYDDDECSEDDLGAIYPELPSHFGALICPRCIDDVKTLRNSAAVQADVNGYLFLKKNYGEIIKSDEKLARLLVEFPFLDGQESTYIPAKDNDHSSLLEAGERALGCMPHEAVIDGISKFNHMKDELMSYLKEIGTAGRVITKEDIDLFFGHNS